MAPARCDPVAKWLCMTSRDVVKRLGTLEQVVAAPPAWLDDFGGVVRALVSRVELLEKNVVSSDSSHGNVDGKDETLWLNLERVMPTVSEEQIWNYDGSSTCECCEEDLMRISSDPSHGDANVVGTEENLWLNLERVMQECLAEVASLDQDSGVGRGHECGGGDEQYHEISFQDFLATLSCWQTVSCNDGDVKWISVNKFNVCTFTRLNASIEHVKFCMHFYSGFVDDFREQIDGMDASDIEMVYECALSLELPEIEVIAQPLRPHHADAMDWRNRPFR